MLMYVCMQERFGAVVDYLESVSARDDSPERAACESVYACMPMCMCECLLTCMPMCMCECLLTYVQWYLVKLPCDIIRGYNAI
jgi:hypothetical protein